MYKENDCIKCLKYKVCKLTEDYNNKCLELNDTSTNDYQSKLHCKHYEGNNDNK